MFIFSCKFNLVSDTIKMQKVFVSQKAWKIAFIILYKINIPPIPYKKTKQTDSCFIIKNSQKKKANSISTMSKYETLHYDDKRM